jgi:serine/threonine-protein kinase
MPDPYKILEVDRKASTPVIKAAWKALVKESQDDEPRLKRLNAAHSLLTDEDDRQEHDAAKANSVKRGKVIGGYRIVGEIADGGFGTTYKAEHRETGCIVCIKHANNISAHDEELLLNEARAVWDLRHWGIPCMRDILRMPDGSVALVMSYVEGPTLAQILEKPEYNSGLDPEHVAWITERLLNTLKYLHFSGIVHGDVKPQNIIIQPEDHTAVLVDYGLSKVKPSRKDRASGYTPFFAAPEQITGGVPIPETDFYGLGMTMIFALGGDVEFVKVPDTTGEHMIGFIKSLIKQKPLARPQWKKEDLCETIQAVRKKDFGRSFSSMKPLDI